jgi:hypothetical protein
MMSKNLLITNCPSIYFKWTAMVPDTTAVMCAIRIKLIFYPLIKQKYCSGFITTGVCFLLLHQLWRPEGLKLIYVNSGLEMSYNRQQIL